MKLVSRQTTTTPYFKFDSGQFLAETMGLPDAMVGMYVRMMALYWEHGCSLPNDDVLKLKLGIRLQKDSDTMKFILSEFFGGDERRHSRLDQGLVEVHALKTRQSANARAGWEARRAKAPKDGQSSVSSIEVDNVDF